MTTALPSYTTSRDVTPAGADENGPDLFIGDFNTGNNHLDLAPGATPFIASGHFDRFGSGRLRDIWRTRNPEVREYSWFSAPANNGFRLDHAFTTAKISGRMTRCEYIHEVRNRGLSDHSALRLEFAASNASGIAPASEPTSVIYAIRDPFRPDLLKIGKDSRWPQRLRQAQSHSPRELKVAGTWIISREEAKLLERRVLNGFTRAEGTDGAEWVTAAGNAIEKISTLLGQQARSRCEISPKPYDDWRDYAKPFRSDRQRRLWLAVERETGRLKVVHSPHVEAFYRICPTFSCLGFRWVSAWQFSAEAWEPSSKLHPTDAAIVELWSSIVSRHGYGEDSPRVGWLRDDISREKLEGELRDHGLVPFLGDDTRGKGAYANLGWLKACEIRSSSNAV